jgi:vacuolar-type H+-ATPase subunit I/STV1
MDNPFSSAFNQIGKVIEARRELDARLHEVKASNERFADAEKEFMRKVNLLSEDERETLRDALAILLDEYERSISST